MIRWTQRRHGISLGWRGARLVTVAGAEVDEEVIERCWRLRAQLIDLRPEVDPADDFAAFAADLRSCWRLSYLADTRGEIVGFMDLYLHPDPTRLVLRGEYGFFAPQWRRRPELPVLFLRLVGSAILLHGRGRPVVFFGDAYPNGYRVFLRFFPKKTFLAGDPELPEETRELLRVYPPIFYGERWQPEQARIRLRTVPRPFSCHSDRDRALIAHYEGINPAWRDGYAAALAVHIDWSFARTVLLDGLARARHTLRARAHSEP